VAEILVGVGV
jgi:solute carrier family 25 carnitine/acylcarnitine transporter 20/29